MLSAISSFSRCSALDALDAVRHLLVQPLLRALKLSAHAPLAAREVLAHAHRGLASRRRSALDVRDRAVELLDGGAGTRADHGRLVRSAVEGLLEVLEALRLRRAVGLGLQLAHHLRLLRRQLLSLLLALR